MGERRFHSRATATSRGTSASHTLDPPHPLASSVLRADPLPHVLRSFDLSWLGERRVKNAVMVMEWVPSEAALGPLVPPGEETDAAAALSEAARARLQKALALFDFDDAGRLDAAALGAVLEASGDDVDVLSDSDLDRVVEDLGVGGSVTHEQAASLLVSGQHKREQTGRRFVLVSLAEA